MKKLIALLLAAVLVLGLAGCVTNLKVDPTVPPKPGDDVEQTAGQMKKFTVTVVHADGSGKDFAYETDAELLGDYLEQQGLIESEGADDGMFHTVDGEKADWNENQSYWSLYIGEEYAMVGIYDTPITDGAAYKLVYTIG